MEAELLETKKALDDLRALVAKELRELIHLSLNEGLDGWNTLNSRKNLLNALPLDMQDELARVENGVNF